ncbi:hypothetical protein Ahy_A02g009329 isoform H [Arachis hypogaea]|uniref:ABC1 atypical kinase-like domain-containing protein n=1 Tax=Arachis hypogaea TaxID=3818 RepID=A0A445EGR2_ARAHY|nr:hypothetical protein Ahy_A02g009329 isoform H [Arachis hypogaea]
MRSRVRDQRVRGGHRRNAAAAAAITVVEEGVQRREREKDDSQTKWRERMKTRREREGGCFAVHCRRSWGQLKPPPLLGLAVLLSSLSASTIDFLRFISAIFDANGTDAILSFEKFCCNLPRPLLQVPVSIWITFLNSILIHLLINWDKVPAFSPKKAKSFIESELGASISLLFREFEDRPIAATSLGQVHRAILHLILCSLLISLSSMLAGLESFKLMKPELFDFIDKYNLQDSIHEKVVQLMMLDCKHVVPLLIQHRDLISPQEVVKQLLNADVELYADYDPKMLLPFLHSSQHYTLEKAYEICTKKELLKEQVFILGRMRNSKQALAVIINKLGDIKEAVEFVTMQNDYELWEELIKQCIDKPEMVYHDNWIVHLNMGMLRDRLVKIITDYMTETLLRHGCNDILKADCVNLLIKYYKEARHGISLGSEEGKPRIKNSEK